MDPYEETFATWNKVAQQYQDKFMDLELYDATYDRFCTRIGPSSRAAILDIGCGPGNITRYLLRKHPRFRVTGIDVSPNMVALAARNNPTARFTVMDCRDLNRLATRFDAIIGGFCIPYLDRTACTRLLRDCHALLPAGGPLYLSFVAGAYERSGYQTGSTGDRTYFYFYLTETILQLLLDSGFEPVDQFAKPYPDAEDPAATHTIVIARKRGAA